MKKADLKDALIEAIKADERNKGGALPHLFGLLQRSATERDRDAVEICAAISRALSRPEWMREIDEARKAKAVGR